MQTILITGCRGQLGLELTRQLGAGCRLILVDIEELDITDSAAVFDQVKKAEPDAVINCAAYTNVDACEHNVDLAYRVNAMGARNLACASFEAGAKMVQISTDYVFSGEGVRDEDGSVRAYVENDRPGPVNVYGKSKLAGEEMVRAHNPHHLIFRTAWLFGEGANFVRTMLRLAKDHDSLTVVNDQWGNPTSTKELARLIIDVMRRPEYGVFHATCEGVCTWYEFACEIFRLRGLETRVVPCTSAEYPRPAPRPRYSMLDNRAARLCGAYSMAHWKDALAEYLKAQEGPC
ncbi:MAG: dTDP-4-dehydrorhamnose reductase [Christensenellales bacterium]|jgi:dTDP-4-dehydrorhamnose reductase